MKDYLFIYECFSIQTRTKILSILSCNVISKRGIVFRKTRRWRRRKMKISRRSQLSWNYPTFISWIPLWHNFSCLSTFHEKYHATETSNPLRVLGTITRSRVFPSNKFSHVSYTCPQITFSTLVTFISCILLIVYVWRIPLRVSSQHFSSIKQKIVAQSKRVSATPRFVYVYVLLRMQLRTALRIEIANLLL